MKVLIVDDNKTNRAILSRMVAAAGGVATCVENGRQALDHLETETPDLIFMDLSMPVMDGFEATERIRRAHSRSALPIYAVSANTTGACEDRCAEIGFNEFIAKPVSRERIARVIELG